MARWLWWWAENELLCVSSPLPGACVYCCCLACGACGACYAWCVCACAACMQSVRLLAAAGNASKPQNARSTGGRSSSSTGRSERRRARELVDSVVCFYLPASACLACCVSVPESLEQSAEWRSGSTQLRRLYVLYRSLPVPSRPRNHRATARRHSPANNNDRARRARSEKRGEDPGRNK